MSIILKTGLCCIKEYESDLFSHLYSNAQYMRATQSIPHLNSTSYSYGSKSQRTKIYIIP